MSFLVFLAFNLRTDLKALPGREREENPDPIHLEPLANSLPGGYMKRDREGKGMLVVP